MKTIVMAAALLGATPVWALDVVPVAEGVYALVGDLGQRSPENLGNNATFGVVVTREGVVLIDAGAGWKAAAAIDAAIDTFTDQPVRYVINSGGQDHRWMGNGYWQAHGAEVIASADAVADHKNRGSMEMTGLNALVGAEGLAGTEPSYADVTFDREYTLSLGGIDLEITHAGQAHTPGDSFIWMPSTGVVFGGDIVYIERILGIGDQSYSGTWIDVFETMAALEPKVVVPGHGHPAPLATATADTYDYLVNLRSRMGAYIEDGGDIIGSVNVDQTAFSYLANFEGLAKRNAQQVFSEMEWE
jgi:glyoxylase-like metal-dependent hydrolase (beta-lactamase superfamily II)